MSDKIAFTKNHSDLSTNQGFQFEFYCDRCGSGFRTRFQASTLSRVTEALNAAGSLFGGLFGQAADLGERARSASWEKAHDDAFTAAMEEYKTFDTAKLELFKKNMEVLESLGTKGLDAFTKAVELTKLGIGL